MKKDLKIIRYLLVILCGIAVFYLLNFIFNGIFFQNVFLNDPYDTFMDFFNPINTEKFEPYYDLHTSYPALPCIIFRIFLQFVPKEFQEVNRVGYDFRTTQMSMIVFIAFNIIIIWSISAIVRHKCKLNQKEQSVLILAMLLSMPFMFALERGNIILLSFVFSLFFCAYFDSPQKWVREMAYIALAIAAAIKIYPAILGLLVVKKGKIKECLHLVIYGILFFFLPFWYFDGIGSFIMLIKDLKYTGNGIYSGYGMNVSLNNLSKTFAAICNINFHDNLIKVIYILTVILLLLAFVMLEEKWKKELVLVMFIILLPKTNYYYVLLYLFIPFIEFLNYCKNSDLSHTGEDKKYAVLFALIFIPWASGRIQKLSEGVRYYVTYSMLINYLAVCGIVLLLFKESIIKKYPDLKYINLLDVIGIFLGAVIFLCTLL